MVRSPGYKSQGHMGRLGVAFQDYESSQTPAKARGCRSARHVENGVRVFGFLSKRPDGFRCQLQFRRNGSLPVYLVSLLVDPMSVGRVGK